MTRTMFAFATIFHGSLFLGSVAVAAWLEDGGNWLWLVWAGLIAPMWLVAGTFSLLTIREITRGERARRKREALL